MQESGVAPMRVSVYLWALFTTPMGTGERRERWGERVVEGEREIRAFEHSKHCSMFCNCSLTLHTLFILSRFHLKVPQQHSGEGFNPGFFQSVCSDLLYAINMDFGAGRMPQW